mmetsp:Transcript_23242/g.49068  ORF Transcript_23242/g.49068 Transcript_23242/m.49068 type:complete len:209 (-) Transcript_23242:127-753(-)
MFKYLELFLMPSPPLLRFHGLHVARRECAIHAPNPKHELIDDDGIHPEALRKELSDGGEKCQLSIIRSGAQAPLRHSNINESNIMHGCGSRIQIQECIINGESIMRLFPVGWRRWVGGGLVGTAATIVAIACLPLFQPPVECCTIQSIHPVQQYLRKRARILFRSASLMIVPRIARTARPHHRLLRRIHLVHARTSPRALPTVHDFDL